MLNSVRQRTATPSQHLNLIIVTNFNPHIAKRIIFFNGIHKKFKFIYP